MKPVSVPFLLVGWSVMRDHVDYEVLRQVDHHVEELVDDPVAVIIGWNVKIEVENQVGDTLVLNY